MRDLSAPAVARFRRPRPPGVLRVVSFNVHHGVGADGRLDLERIARVVETADVACLQEVDRHWSERSGFADQASWLAGRLRARLVYGANLHRDPPAPGRPRRRYGTAILTRHPVLEEDITWLPRRPGHEQRGLLRALVAVRGVRVQVFTTHLQNDDAGERLDQARAIGPLVASRAGPVVLTGDLNAGPGTPEVGALTEVLADVWPRAGQGDGRTCPAGGPGARIDYVFTSPGVAVAAAAVVPCDASDHLPVFADLRVGT
ncbi:endonuclease/exonuclease/phosphatase family protein [Nonomuraea aridisoli]|uniref:Metal-dependent hydrolase n=1 Tax=Nonomuraea aridisoli TaxID=2070368 RepID=A0A2W2FUH2_9ACTN|nr:endonuclease/exonuclease/phosphatase family protein [Nonomuraea aridisoli]PZG18524.1 metal-dependent hydrolase [Nonomuraea aridisoli]